MDRTSITFIISDINSSVAFEWLFSALVKEFELKVILINQTRPELTDYLTANGIEHRYIQCRTKKDWPLALWQTFKQLKKWSPCIVHCHLIQASILGLFAAKLARVKIKIYTRHHSSEHHYFYPKGLVWDKFCNSLADKIIAISSSVADILRTWEKVPDNKIVQIPHGFKTEAFKIVSKDRVKAIQEKYKFGGSYPVIGVISRLVEWKGVQYIIPAFKKLIKSFPDATLVLLNAKGDFENEINERLSSIPLKNRRLILFEKDIPAMYHCMDVFVHVPINSHCEAFGQIYVEALSAGVPSVFTLSGIAPEFVKDGYNAKVVPYKDSEEIYKGIANILASDRLRSTLTKNGPSSTDYFTFERYISDLTYLYKGSGC